MQKYTHYFIRNSVIVNDPKILNLIILADIPNAEESEAEEDDETIPVATEVENTIDTKG